VRPKRLRNRLAAGVLAAAASLTPATGWALEITDVTGRTVTLDAPAERVILGEGRLFYALGALGLDDPPGRVAGMLNDFRKLDPAGFARFQDAYPGIDEIPVFGQTTGASVSVETAVALQPDAAVFTTGGHGPGARSAKMVDTLRAAGIPVVFVDFRTDPLRNTPRSMRILASLLGEAAKGERFAAFYRAQTERVTERLAAAEIERPDVVLEVHVGLRDQCCFSLADGSLADLIAAAGGRNVAADRLPGAAGMLNLEMVLAAEPHVYLGTAIGTVSGRMAAPGRIVLGPGVDRQTARQSLDAAVDRPGLRQLRAVRTGRAYGIWHHLYNSPLNLYALHRLAVWLNPDLFPDLDPEDTLRALLRRYRPVDLSGTYGIRLQEGTGGGER
jgi:iron complex transport system substrate-binding protein